MICDPPYGIRVCSRKATDSGDAKTSSGKGTFDINAVYESLIELASTLLRPGGRLVFFFHTDESKQDTDLAFLESLSKRACFNLIDISDNEFMDKRKRHMITM